jgi:hypothetical protein
MKFDTNHDQPLTTESYPKIKMCYVRKNEVIPITPSNTNGKGRCSLFWVNSFLTPVMSSERLASKDDRCLVSNDGVDELMCSLERLNLTGTPEILPREERKKTERSAVSPISIVKLINETPEAKNPKLGRCLQTMINPSTMMAIEVKRSMRLVKA